MSRDRFYQYQPICNRNRDDDMERMVEIPPPVVKKDKTEYLEELSKIAEAEQWIKKHSANEATTEPETRVIKVKEKVYESPKWTPFETKITIILVILGISVFGFGWYERFPLLTLFFGMACMVFAYWLKVKHSWLVRKMFAIDVTILL